MKVEGLDPWRERRPERPWLSALGYGRCQRCGRKTDQGVVISFSFYCIACQERVQREAAPFLPGHNSRSSREAQMREQALSGSQGPPPPAATFVPLLMSEEEAARRLGRLLPSLN